MEGLCAHQLDAPQLYVGQPGLVWCALLLLPLLLPGLERALGSRAPALTPPLTPPSATQTEYTSNLADFLDTHTLQNLTKPSSLADAHANLEAIEAYFCTPEK